MTLWCKTLSEEDTDEIANNIVPPKENAVAYYLTKFAFSFFEDCMWTLFGSILQKHEAQI